MVLEWHAHARREEARRALMAGDLERARASLEEAQRLTGSCESTRALEGLLTILGWDN